MAIQIFDEFLKEFEQPITAFVSNSVQNLAAAIDTPLRTAVTLWVVLYGIAILRGTIREPIMSFAWSAARVIVIVALATNASTFQTYVTGLFFESLPKEIGNAIAGAGLDTSSGVPFDKLLNKGIEVATKIYEQSGLTNIAPALIAAILMVFTAVSGFLQFAVLLYAKIGLGIVIALGPLFIALMLFEVTAAAPHGAPVCRDERRSTARPSVRPGCLREHCRRPSARRCRRSSGKCSGHGQTRSPSGKRSHKQR